MIKYIGSKRALLPIILAQIESLGPRVRTVLDLFSGTSRVGHALKSAGYCVLANDHNAYAHVLGTCYVQADEEKVGDAARKLLAELQTTPPSPGWFTETFCSERDDGPRFFHPKNGARIDAIREAIAKKGLDPELEAVVLTSLMEAADRVDSTTGLQMAYLKDWAPRAHRDLELRMPAILPRAKNGKSRAHRLDALDAAKKLVADVAYVDPPYNQHSYLGNYHVWESLVLWDKPEVYGVARKRVDVRERKSAFNAKATAFTALRETIAAIRARHLVVSFNDEGYVSRAEIEAILRARGHVRVVEIDYKRYVGAQIGIHNPKGEKVGTVGKLRNKEMLFVVSPGVPGDVQLALPL